MLDLKIVGGTIVDGTGATRYRGDVGVKDGRVALMGKVDEPARETIDATGKIVSPGFIDVHTHYDAQVFWDPTLSPSSYHGVTTIFGGFCGFSIAPLTQESGAYLMPMLARVEGMPLESLRKGVPWNWHSFAEYLSRFEGTLAINAGFMAGHSTIRRYVMRERAVGALATREEIDEMKEILRESIRGGALGFSTTLSKGHNDADGNPVPSRHGSREELLDLFSVISEFDGTIAEMIPAVDFDDEVYEILTQVSLAAQRPVNWNALLVDSMAPEELEQLEKKLGAANYARERGAEVVALTPPITPTVRMNLISGFIFDAIPGWAPFFRLSIAERIERLKDPECVSKMKTEWESVTGTMKQFFVWAQLKLDETFSERAKRYQDRTVGAIAAEEGRHPFDVFVDIVLADDLRTSFLVMPEGETLELFRKRAEVWLDSRAVVGASDAGAHLDMIDTFAVGTSLLAYGVRQHAVISLEEGVHQLTQKAAQLMGLRERGVLQQGWHADIVIFDADAVGPGEVYTRDDLPEHGMRLYSDAQGIQSVIVNGREIIRNGNYLGVAAGVILRPGKDTYTVGIPAFAEAAAN